MNREILFRGKQVDDGQWVYGYYQNIDNKINGYYGAWIATGNGHEKFKIHPETVGQFTGLLDKNGNKIFEGDVIRALSEVGFDHGTHKGKNFQVFFYIENGAWYIRRTYNESEEMGLIKLCIEMLANCDVEIIGNIHDNPELINQ